MTPNGLRFDEIGNWSEIKLDIVKKYAAAYSKIINSKKLEPVYIDAFAGPGLHISRATKEFVSGSPLNALLVRPTFVEYHFIDLKSEKTASLREIIGDRPDVHIYPGDCNEILLHQEFAMRIFGVAFASLTLMGCILDGKLFVRPLR